MAKCPICGNEYQKTEACPECAKKIHKKLTISCVLECPPNGISKQDGVYILDQITKLFIGRGIAPIDIDFLEPYVWMDVEIQPDEIKKLQKEGVLQS